jgi:Tfp pilus assembly protein PilX
MAEEGRKARDMTRYFPKTLRGQEGVALIISLIILVLITGLGIGAIMYARMDASVSGYYRAQREAEVAADSALELAMAMIFSDDPLL